MDFDDVFMFVVVIGVCVLLMFVIFAEDKTPEEISTANNQVISMLEGKHELNKRASGAYFDIVDTDHGRRYQFEWRMNDGTYKESELHTNYVRIQYDENNINDINKHEENDDDQAGIDTDDD